MVVMGLCVGHDSLFHQHAKAPYTTHAVKDCRSAVNDAASPGPCAAANAAPMRPGAALPASLSRYVGLPQEDGVAPDGHGTREASRA